MKSEYKYRYRTKPGEVEAVQLKPWPQPTVPQFIHDAIQIGPDSGGIMRMGDSVHVFGSKFTTVAEIGDYIVKSADGELFRYSAGEFEATYEPTAQLSPPDTLAAAEEAVELLREVAGMLRTEGCTTTPVKCEAITDRLVAALENRGR